MRRRVLLLLALLAATAAAPLAPGAVAGAGECSRGSHPVHGGAPGVSGYFGACPAAGSGGALLVTSRPVDAWLHVRAWEAPVEGVVTLEAENATLNRSRAAVSIPAGGWASVPVRVSNATGADARLSASLSAGGREVLAFTQRVDVAAPVSVAYLAPRPPGHANAVHAGRDAPVVFKARVSNPLSTPSPAVNLSVRAHYWSDGRHFEPAVATVAVPPLAPGASREVAFPAFVLEDASLPAPPRAPAHGVLFSLGVDAGAPWGAHPAYAYGFADGHVVNPRWGLHRVAFHGGLAHYLEGARLDPGGPSWVTVAVANHDDRPREARVDVWARPDPPAHYGPGTAVAASREATVAPGETARFNVTVAPRVTGRWEVGYRVWSDGYREGVLGHEVWVPSLITTRYPERLEFEMDVGEARAFAINVTANGNATGATVGLAVAVHGGPSGVRGVPVLGGFVTPGDVVGLSWSPRGVDLAAGETVVVNATVEARAAGSFELVPFVRVGAVVHPGIWGHYSGTKSVAVHPEGVPAANLWLPAVVALAGAAALALAGRRRG